MVKDFGYSVGEATVAVKFEDYYVWDCSVIYTGGKYHLFCSRWKKELGFGWNWLFNSEIVHCVSDKPEGPYEFKNVALPRRGREFFDGMNTHNTCIREYNGKFYLYYMGTTYGFDSSDVSKLNFGHADETWNRKRIGLAVADDINGEFKRLDSPILEPRDCTHWDCTITTNPMAVIMPTGKTYMIYKSRKGYGCPLQLGIAVADKPDGKFERLTEEPLFNFPNEDFHIEDPFIWYDKKRNKFCLIAKDDIKNGKYGITGEWGSGFYAESDDCKEFKIAPNPTVYTRSVKWADGTVTKQCNLERPSLLFDDNGEPTHLFCATGSGKAPFEFDGLTYVACIKLNRK